MITATAVLAAVLAASSQEARPSDGGAPTDAIRFTDVTATSGIDLVTTSGTPPLTTILEVKGGGLALLDYDSDGDLDLFAPNGATLADPEKGPGARLFRNDGGLRFTDVTATSGIAHRRWSFGTAVGDVDGDGHDDLFIACFGPNVLLRNRGDGTFEDITARAGVGDPAWATSAAFADLDLDGDLDLFVCNYLAFDPAQPLPPASFKGMPVLAGPRGYAPAPDRVYENRGDGTFVDRSVESGIAAGPARFALNVAILDFTGDGRPDILVGNDSQANALWTAPRGEPAPWRFTDEGLRSGIAVNGEGGEQATMGMAVADVDGNGRPDVFTTNFSSDTNTLHLNLDGRSFDDRTNQFGLGAPSRTLVGWGAAFADLDHDGDEDLLSVNGHVYPQATKSLMDSDWAQRPLLMERRGRRFAPLAKAGAWPLAPRVDRTLVVADLDGDGDLDAVVAGLNEPLQVLRNDHDRGDDWLVVVPRDSRPGIGNRHATGVEVIVRAGDVVQRRWLPGGGPFQSNLPPELHFGLPNGLDADAGPVDLEVRFADGARLERPGVARGSRVTVDRAEAIPPGGGGAENDATPSP
ncbi:MAG: hypothetical protein RI967_484 [Planctomycetota bacterium]